MTVAMASILLVALPMAPLDESWTRTREPPDCPGGVCCWTAKPRMPECCVQNFSSHWPGVNFNAQDPATCAIGTTIPTANPMCKLTCEEGYQEKNGRSDAYLECKTGHPPSLEEKFPVCEPCSSTSYKSTAGLEACEECPLHTGTNRSGATSRASCSSCARGYEGVPLPPTCSGAPGVQCNGNDLGNAQTTESATACCKLCRQDKDCGAWTWNGPQASAANTCWLKSECREGDRVQAAGYVSGLSGLLLDKVVPSKTQQAMADCVYEEDVDCGRLGPQYTVPKQVASAAMCCKECLSNSTRVDSHDMTSFSCRAWTWQRGSKTCVLKANCDGKESKDGRISGGTCRGRACPSTLPVAHSDAACGTTAKYGDGKEGDDASKCQLQCKDGFNVDAQASDEFACTAAGHWTGDAKCRGIKCNNSMPVVRGTSVGCSDKRYSESESGEPSTICSISCDLGYAPPDDLLSTYNKAGGPGIQYACQHDGTWKEIGPKLVCLKVCTHGTYGNECEKNCDASSAGTQRRANITCDVRKQDRGNPKGCNGCVHGGTCHKEMIQNPGATFNCSCISPYTDGSFCENKDPCTPNPCEYRFTIPGRSSSGDCSFDKNFAMGEYKCNCVPPWTSDCDQNEDPGCQPNCRHFQYGEIGTPTVIFTGVMGLVVVYLLLPKWLQSNGVPYGLIEQYKHEVETLEYRPCFSDYEAFYDKIIKSNYQLSDDPRPRGKRYQQRRCLITYNELSGDEQLDDALQNKDLKSPEEVKQNGGDDSGSTDIRWFGVFMFVFGIFDLFMDLWLPYKLWRCSKSGVPILCILSLIVAFATFVTTAILSEWTIKEATRKVGERAKRWRDRHRTGVLLVYIASLSRVNSLAIFRCSLLQDKSGDPHSWRDLFAFPGEGETPIDKIWRPQSGRHEIFYYLQVRGGRYHYFVEDIPHALISIMMLAGWTKEDLDVCEDGIWFIDSGRPETVAWANLICAALSMFVGMSMARINSDMVEGTVKSHAQQLQEIIGRASVWGRESVQQVLEGSGYRPIEQHSSEPVPPPEPQPQPQPQPTSEPEQKMLRQNSAPERLKPPQGTAVVGVSSPSSPSPTTPGVQGSDSRSRPASPAIQIGGAE